MKKQIIFVLTSLVLVSCMKEEDHRIDLSYSGEQLRYIACPLGGIATGNLLLNGYGAISNIEIFNRPAMDKEPPYMTSFSIYTETKSGERNAKVLEREFPGGSPEARGKSSQQMGGLPRFSDAIFHNAYPFVGIEFMDESVPLSVEMQAWSPMIPVDPLNSSIPAAVIEWKLSNPTETPVKYSLAFTMANPMREFAGDDKESHEVATMVPYLSNRWKGITFSTPVEDSRIPGAGKFRVLFPAEGWLSTPLPCGGRRDDAQLFWNDFASDGQLALRMDTVVQNNSDCKTAAMYLSGSLDPGEAVTIPFVFSWHVPYREVVPGVINNKKGVDGSIEKNYYAVRFQDIDTLTAYLLDRLSFLREKTLSFSETMITSSVPSYILDATISNMASLNSNLITQNSEGDYYCYTGLDDHSGLLPWNSTHVWNYAQSLAMLFPSIERNMRETGFRRSTNIHGYQNYRTMTTPSEEIKEGISTDGQYGNIMRVYREWKMSGDNEWLGFIWPKVKAALEFAWEGPGSMMDKNSQMDDNHFPWDPYQEGVLKMSQNTTYGVDLYGPNMMTGSLYLGALKACSEMAVVMNEPQNATLYNSLYEKGRERYRELLWNDSCFIQKDELPVFENIQGKATVNSSAENLVQVPKYQVGGGCMSDQLLGQYLAFVSGLGDLMNPEETSRALLSVYENNFREELRDVAHTGNIYGFNGESGLINCSWPYGDMPKFPLIHSGEVWTGVEYQVAASLIYVGHVDEGLKIAASVRSRYDGSNRNPFAEIEQGRYNARALSSWGVYQAMAGYRFNGVDGEMEFAPAEDVLPIRYFWSAGSGWGKLAVSRGKIELTCLGGTLTLKQLLLAGKSFFVFREFIPSHAAEISYKENRLVIEFPEDLYLSEGNTFIMELP